MTENNDRSNRFQISESAKRFRVSKAEPLPRDISQAERKRLYVARLDQLQRDIAAMEAATVAEVEALVGKMAGEVAANVTRDYQIETAAEKIAASVKNLQGQTKETVNRIWADVEDKFRTQLQTAGNLGQEAIDELMTIMGENVLGEAAFNKAGIDNLKLMTDFSADLIVQVKDDIIQKVNTQIALGSTGGISPGEMIANIEDFIPTGTTRFASMTRGPLMRAEAIVRTEVGRLYSVAQQMRIDQFEDAGIKTFKVWNHSAGSAHPREGHIAMDGQKIKNDELFVNPETGEELRYPRDPAAPPSETINCGCYMTIESEKFGDLFKG